MHVLATAGHVDHGKSTLVRALTGMEPDRFAEERRRGMTIDLGYAWTTLPTGEVLAFVDVPGHQRFIGTMLAGLGPAPAVLFVVAADEGWRRQSTEHLAAVQALGLTHGVLAVTRSDLADPSSATLDALAHLSDAGVDAVPVAVSGRTGAGLDELRSALAQVVTRLPAADQGAAVRLWVDRSFTVKGAGTVVTGTLGAGQVRVGDRLLLRGSEVVVRGLQSLGAAVDEVGAVARVAVNLRGADRDQVRRGDALLTPRAWRESSQLDVAVTGDPPAQAVLHLGTAAVPVRVRPLGDGVARLLLERPLPVRQGDRGLLRDPAAQHVAGGFVVLDVDPPALTRRGAARRRALELERAPDVAAEVARRGAVRADDLRRNGITGDRGDVLEVAGLLVDPTAWADWLVRLTQEVDRHAASDPLAPGLPDGHALQRLALPPALLATLVQAAGLEHVGGRLRRPGAAPVVPPGVLALRAHLTERPFDAPEAPEVAALGAKAVAAAVATGQLLRLDGDVLLLPDGPARAMRLLAALPQPFTLSEARQALGTTRRVAVPLLEHLDGRGWTRRIDGSRREVAR